MLRTIAITLSLLSLALSGVTAAVTFARGQVPGQYSVVITNRATGHKLTYNKRSWPDQNRCDAAIRGLTEALNSVAAMRFNEQGEIVGELVPAPDADEKITDSLDNLLERMVENTGTFPNLSISCELPGDPA